MSFLKHVPSIKEGDALASPSFIGFALKAGEEYCLIGEKGLMLSYILFASAPKIITYQNQAQFGIFLPARDTFRRTYPSVS